MEKLLVALPSVSPVTALPARECAGCNRPIYLTLEYVARLTHWLSNGHELALICHACARQIEPVMHLFGGLMRVEWLGADTPNRPEGAKRVHGI